MINIREPSRQQKLGTGYLNYALASALFLGSVFAAKNAVSSKTKRNASAGGSSLSKRFGITEIEKEKSNPPSEPKRLGDTIFKLDMEDDVKVEEANGEVIDQTYLFFTRGDKLQYRFCRRGHKDKLKRDQLHILLAHTYLGRLTKNFLGLDYTYLNELHPDGANFIEATADIRKLRLIADVAIDSKQNLEFSYVADSFDGCVGHAKGFLKHSYSKERLEEKLITLLNLGRLPKYDELKEVLHIQDFDSKIYLFFNIFVAILDSEGPTETIGCTDYGPTLGGVKLLDIFVVSKRPPGADSAPINPKSPADSQLGSSPSSKQSSSEMDKHETEANGASSQAKLSAGRPSQVAETHTKITTETVNDKVKTKVEVFGSDGTIIAAYETSQPKKTGGQDCDSSPRYYRTKTTNKWTGWTLSSPSKSCMICDTSLENSGTVKDEKKDESSEVTSTDSSIQVVVLKDDGSGDGQICYSEDQDDFIVLSEAEA